MGDHPVLQLLDPPAELDQLGAEARVVGLRTSPVTMMYGSPSEAETASSVRYWNAS